MIKVCSKCGGADFVKKGCRACLASSNAAWRAANSEHLAAYKARNRERDRAKEAEYRAKNPDKVVASRQRFVATHPGKMTEYQRRHYCENRDEIKQRSRDYYAANKDRLSELAKKWKASNPEKRAEIARRYKEKVRSTPEGKLASRIAARIRAAFASGGYKKSGKTAEILGCDWEFFKSHIERQFLPDMTWARFGSEIHLDHIVPIASAECEDDIVRLNHFTNLRPLWSIDNMKKGDRREHLL